jgi:alpha-L-fucosidase
MAKKGTQQVAEYNKHSPYYGTDLYGKYLDLMTYRDIPAKPDDVTYQIDAVYQYRPDLLAFDLYGNSNLWWVFAVRNPNVLKNPLGDFRAGATIKIPKQSTINLALGL